jgi:hypothetical protein
MFILNAGLSHKLKDWLMSLSTEIERTKRCWTGTLFGNQVISGAVDLGFRSTLYGWKAKT